jgi:hypothetical protein
MSRLGIGTSTAIAALTLLAGTALSTSAQEKTLKKIPITHKHLSPRVHAIVERNTEPERTCVATPPSRWGSEENRRSAQNPSRLPWCGGGVPDFGSA